MIKIVALIAAFGCLASCGHIGTDFDKATYVGRVDLSDSRPHSFRVDLAEGDASLIVAVPGYNCADIKPDAVLEVSIAGEAVSAASARIALHELTWSYANRSCDAFGYVRDKRLTATIPRKGATVRLTFAIDAARHVASSEQILLWYVYGDRVPTSRVFEPGTK
jgi:hypothetical protein